MKAFADNRSYQTVIISPAHPFLGLEQKHCVALFYSDIYKTNQISSEEEVFKVLFCVVCIIEILTYLLYRGFKEEKNLICLHRLNSSKY